ncbi:transcriptional regulator [Pseudomonas putida]|uniref:Transcriptional regulator n=1 Tax=Pseudomonas putida TaxID=303 RepID=A0AA37RIH5_PSEPU|nr:AraC family transcriptional regulator [Pseudomonas putida]GLO16098.1 transcriptional regulator [Pseudomonas putida]GLO37843.1 transcriptional regulator [Pseudomonas putida]HDS0965065.1 helix-turn-helix domain-containing protein [Pseudomonas putida]HDS0991447.1 helix-turn-helix domain-containing protein [Pseudomonas putida]
MPAELHINTIATTTGAHNHDHQQVMIGLEGRMDCELPSVSAPLLRGAIGFLPSGTMHLYAGRDEGCRVLVLDYDIDDPFISALYDASGYQASTFKENQALIQKPSNALARLLTQYSTQGRLNSLHQPAVKNQIISGILTEIMIGENSRLTREIRSSRLDPAQLQNWIDYHLDEPITVAQIADTFHISESYLYVLLKNLMGCSPLQYLTQRRMQRAADLLKKEKLLVGHIACQVGYADTAAFDKAFRNFFGITPRQYRNDTDVEG